MTKFNIEALELLKMALEEPGVISKCYGAFHNYSVLNALALFRQCRERGLAVGPCASFNKWKELGGMVKKGSKALWVNVPCSVKVKSEDGEEEDKITYFSWRPLVFTLAQVDIDKPMDNVHTVWSKDKALAKLGIKEIPFAYVDGNTQGYATPAGIAINPLGAHKTRTLVHELAHSILHLGSKKPVEHNLQEVEAEGVSFVVGFALGLDGAAESRGYMQHWLGANELPRKSALRILACANKILKAGE